ncbi:hypothetical protein F2Q69_00033777 [Brassica cretica]|uniref:Uncharacterized protein n=1 Tax=Brassica cretica TaxID=69181 RepID=A0A8S9SP57_BRACR|nr:hypothetical protein F2Q69_00033777 [Brassica cretica]
MEFPDKDETDSEMATQEFNFQPEKRVQQDLPTDLFSKLSIKSELKQNNGSRLRFTQAKGFKENRVNSFQAGNEVTPVEKIVSSAGQHIQSGHIRIIPETNQRWTASRQANKAITQTHLSRMFYNRALPYADGI